MLIQLIFESVAYHMLSKKQQNVYSEVGGLPTQKHQYLMIQENDSTSYKVLFYEKSLQ